MPNNYPPGFRRQMLELVRAGRTPEELAKDFQPSAQSIRTWVRQADLDDGRRQDGLTSAEKEELARLRRENKILRAKKAAALRKTSFSTFHVKTIASHRTITASADGTGLLSHAGSLLLLKTLHVTDLDRALSAQLEHWRPARAVHDPGKIVADLAVSLALGGDCLADIALLRAQPDLFGSVASDPTVSRLIDRLARDEAKALKALRAARALARERAWNLAATRAPGGDGELIPLDLDATIVIAHSDKQHAAPTWKHTFGFHPMTVFADHGPQGSGEPLAIVLRRATPASNTAADYIEAIRLAPAQLPKHRRRQVLIHTDSGGGTHE